MPQLNSGLRWLLVVPAMFLLILPFPHTVSLRLVTLAISFVGAITLWRRLAPPPIPCKWPIAIWAILACLSLLVAVDLPYSLGEIKNEIGYTVIAFVTFYAFTQNERILRRFLGVICLAFVGISLWALWGRYHVGVWREQGYVMGAASYGTYMVTIAPLLLLAGNFLRGGKTVWLAVVIGLLSLGLVCSYLALQRTTLPILFVQAGIALILFKLRGMVKLSWRTIAVGLFAGLVLTVGALQMISHDRFKLGFMASSVGDIRAKKLEPVMERIMTEPLRGYGFGRRAMAKAHPDLVNDEWIFWHAHNVFLNYGLEMGFPGIAVLIALFVSLGTKFWRLYRADDPFIATIGIAGLLVIVGVILRNQTNDMFVRDLSLLFWSICGILLGLGHRRVAALRNA